ncbi:MAG: Mov34/MPN/PAD-1 family protein [Candidatus Omnitrophica bacterium]|nr:Mov34/MPN/PAD-1 family protein [Candidatus Omnitrophota bacterium]
MLILKKELFEKIVSQIKRESPNEACGILAGKDGKVEKVYEMTNIDKSPSTFFMDAKEQLKVIKEIRSLGLEMLGIYHSHVVSVAYPSARDIELAFYPEVSYVIISLKDKDNPQVRSFKIIEGKIEEEKVIVRKNILFVCRENSCRSQIAEAIVNNFYWQKFLAYSAGSKPSGKINPLAIEVMKEIGIDISGQKSKGFDQIKGIEFDYVITMGCTDYCPIYPAKQKFEWEISDPEGKPKEFFRQIREEIKNKIKELSEQIG